MSGSHGASSPGDADDTGGMGSGGWGPPYPPPDPSHQQAHLSYPPPYRPRRRHRLRTLLGLFLLVVVAVVAGIGLDHAFWRSGSTAAGPPVGGARPYSPTAPSAPAAPVAPSSPAGGSAGVAAQVDQELVNIDVTLGYQGIQAAGTGIVLTSTGEVLTNNHVIDGATRISVTDVGNGRTYSATVVGYDRSGDLAVLQLQGASGLATAKLGDSAKVAVGDSVLAIGNAGGTGQIPSTAAGSVTALDQSITAGDEATGESEQLSGLIQVNADVQPGDSGGPLVDSSGTVIGMDTAASQGRSFQSSEESQGFAIPIDSALPVVRQIEAGTADATVHTGPTPFLGVEIGTGVGAQAQSGALVAGVVPGSPAAQAGLAAGDVITSVGGGTVSTASALTTLVGDSRPGARVVVQWTDAGGAQHSATVSLASGPAE